MTTEMTNNVTMNNVFTAVFTKGNDVFVAVNAPSVKAFREAAAATVEVRKTKRFSVEKTADRVLFKFVREDMKLRGKHVHIHLLTSTGKDNLFREKGKFVSITDEFTRVVV